MGILIKAKLINSTNAKFTYMINKTGQLHFKKTYSANFFYIDNLQEGYLVTSVVKAIELKDNVLYLNTLNSVYAFEIIEFMDSTIEELKREINE